MTVFTLGELAFEELLNPQEGLWKTHETLPIELLGPYFAKPEDAALREGILWPRFDVLTDFSIGRECAKAIKASNVLRLETTMTHALEAIVVPKMESYWASQHKMPLANLPTARLVFTWKIPEIVFDDPKPTWKLRSVSAFKGTRVPYQAKHAKPV